MNSTATMQSLCASASRACLWLFLGLALGLTAGCGRVSRSQAKQLVERYNQVVCEAYRNSDVRLVDPVVGPNEGKKLTGLIGVRLDLGLALDAKLESLAVTGVEQARDEIRVRTNERWSYRDVRLATGEQVGEASSDAYEMLYVFKRMQDAWLVDEIRFTSPPQVGRKQTPWLAGNDAHSLSASAPVGEGKHP